MSDVTIAAAYDVATHDATASHDATSHETASHDATAHRETRLSLYDISMHQVRESDATVTTTWQIEHVQMMHDVGGMQHAIITRADGTKHGDASTDASTSASTHASTDASTHASTDTSTHQLTLEHMFVPCDEQHEMRVSWMLTCHALDVYIMPDVITAWMHYMPIAFTIAHAMRIS